MRLIIFIFFFSFILGACTAQQPGVQNVNTADFQKQISTPDAIVLDVRTPEEFSSGHLKGSKNIDWYDGSFVKKVEAAAPDKSKTVYVYCKSGGRSGQAANALSKAGYKNIVNMNGGISAWQAAGLPLE